MPGDIQLSDSDGIFLCKNKPYLWEKISCALQDENPFHGVIVMKTPSLSKLFKTIKGMI